MEGSANVSASKRKLESELEQCKENIDELQQQMQLVRNQMTESDEMGLDLFIFS